MSGVTLDQVRVEAQRQFASPHRRSYASPTHMGMVAAKLGAEIGINPYEPGSRAYHSFVRAFLDARTRVTLDPQ